MREKLGEILIKAGVIDELGLQRALSEQQRWGGQLGRYLVELGLITEELLVRALSTQYKLPAVALDPPRLSVAVGRLVSREICERHSIVCFRADTKARFLDVAMSDPSNLDAIDEVRVATQYNVRPHIAAPSAIDQAIRCVFYGEGMLGGELDLSPSSPLRSDPLSGGTLRPQPPRPAPPAPPQPAAPSHHAEPPAPPARQRDPSREAAVLEWSPGVTPIPSPAPPSIDVQVTPSAAADVHSAVTPQSLWLPPPDETFHITMDVPAADKEVLAKALPSVEDRLVIVEGTIARDSAILQRLMEALVARGIFSREEILKIISGR